MTTWEVTRVFDLAILLRSDQWEPESAASLARSLGSIEGALAAVPGYDSIYIVVERDVDDGSLAEALGKRRKEGELSDRKIRVAIDPTSGPDLEEFLARQKIDRSELTAILEKEVLRVRHLGFSPGFAYLEGLPELFDLPRHATPRSRVAAGSFGVAAGLAGFYPRESPGGWWILGKSDAVLWDELRDPPNLLRPGDRVRLETCSPDDLDDVRPDPRLSPRGEVFGEVIDPGSFLLEVDALPDWKMMEVGRYSGGAYDTEAAIVANRAVGNDESARVLEIFDRGPSIRLERDALFSWIGESPVEIDGRPVSTPAQFQVRRGSVLTIGRSERSARGWLAMRGGFSTMRSRPFLAGMSIHGGPESAGRPRIGKIERENRFVVEAAAGPGRSSPRTLEALSGVRWRLEQASNRVGARLRPDRPVDAHPGHVSSIGAQQGSVQWTPEGELIVLGPEHPVTGGYPQPFTLFRSELWKIGALRPGEEIRFTIERPAICSELKV